MASRLLTKPPAGGLKSRFKPAAAVCRPTAVPRHANTMAVRCRTHKPCRYLKHQAPRPPAPACCPAHSATKLRAPAPGYPACCPAGPGTQGSLACGTFAMDHELGNDRCDSFGNSMRTAKQGLAFRHGRRPLPLTDSNTIWSQTSCHRLALMSPRTAEYRREMTTQALSHRKHCQNCRRAT